MSSVGKKKVPELQSVPPLKRQKCMVSQTYFDLTKSHAAHTSLTILLWCTKLMLHYTTYFCEPMQTDAKAIIMASRLTMVALQIELLLEAFYRFVQPGNGKPVIVEYQTFNCTDGCKLLFDTVDSWHGVTGNDMLLAVKRAWAAIKGNRTTYTQFALSTSDAVARLRNLTIEAVRLEGNGNTDGTSRPSMIIRDVKVWLVMQFARADIFIRKSPHAEELQPEFLAMCEHVTGRRPSGV